MHIRTFRQGQTSKSITAFFICLGFGAMLSCASVFAQQTESKTDFPAQPPSEKPEDVEQEQADQKRKTLGTKIVETLTPIVVLPLDSPWLDESNTRLANTVQVAAESLDGFFGDENVADKQTASSWGKWRVGWEPRTRDLSSFEVRFKVRVNLPILEQKAQLFISDEGDEVPENTVIAARDALSSREEKVKIGVRYQRTPDSDVSYRVGIGRRAQMYVKAKYERGIGLTDHIDFNWNGALYYYSSDGLGADAGFTFDWAPRVEGLIRFDNQYYYREEDDEWFWEHNLQYFETVNRKNAVSYNLYFQGNTRPNYRMELGIATFKWRFNAVRDWLFFEIEPFIGWRRDEKFDPTYGIGLRVEGFFGE